MGSSEENSLDSLEELKALCKLLRDSGDRIMRGETSITVTGQMLCKLNDALDNLQDGLSPPHLSLNVHDVHQEHQRAAELEEWNNHLQLLLDILARSPVLTVYSGSEQDKLAYRCGLFPVPNSPPIRLGYFASLQQLSVSYIPIGLIQDLLKLRPRLQSLSLTNCLGHGAHLQDILEVCDSEISVPMQWTSLKHLSLRCNGLRELDGSLRLCPVLETLDLSRNQLTTTDVYLGYLMELRKIDLSYNHLEILPSVAATTKRKLHTLLLAGNNLADLAGIDDMDSLLVLDLSENHISSHSKLVPLRQLHHLEQLSLRGCPISMKKQHRVVSLHYISSLALSRKFTLDGHLATVNEIRSSRLSVHRDPPHYHTATSANTFVVSNRAVNHIEDTPSSVVSGSVSHESVDRGLSSNIPVVQGGKKKSRKKAKQRTLEIADMDTSTGGDYSSREISPASSYQPSLKLEAAVDSRRKEVRKTQQEIEELRLHYGENWLQAITDQQKLPQPAAVTATSSSTSATAVPAVASSSWRDGMLQKSGVKVDVLSSRAAAVAAESPAEMSGLATELRRVVHWNSMKSETHESHQRIVHADVEVKAFVQNSMLSESCSESESDVVSSHSKYNDKTADDSKQLDKTPDECHPDIADKGTINQGFTQDENTKETVQNTSNRADEESFQYMDKSKKHSFETNVTTTESITCQDIIQEPEDQSEPFIVMVPDKVDDHLIVTVSPRYLVEKDINGKITEILDLQSLEGAKLEAEKADNKDTSSEDGPETADHQAVQIVKVRLDFSYVRKDRRLRIYMMEDFATAQHFMELVQPFLEAKADAALRKLLTEYQCLKCNEVFTKGRAHATVQMDNFPRTGSVKDFSSMPEMGGEKVILMCPKCQSDHVIQLESSTEEKVAGAATPPVGSLPSTSPLRSSFKRKQSLDQLMQSQSPAAHSTPHKHFGSSSETQFSRSIERTGQMARAGKQGNAFRSLFTPDDKQLIGDGPDFLSCMDDSLQQKQDGLPEGRQRSNAFCVDLPSVNAAHVTGGNVKCTFSLNTDEKIFVASTSSSLGVVPVLGAHHKGAVSSVNNPGSSISVDLQNGSGHNRMSSVDSDITILRHQDSIGSVGALSSGISDSETFSYDNRSIPAAKLTAGSEFLSLPLEKGVETKTSETKDSKVVGTESAEVTPLGSPLSSSVCSSMVSSIYHNSLQPNTSSSVYLTASDHSSVVAAEGGEREGEAREEEEAELSIYDQTVMTSRTRSPHKVSISSEVEVLMIEEQAAKDSLPAGDAPDGKDATEHTETHVDSSDHSDGPEEGAEAGWGDAGIGNSYNFDRMDHRLALHLMMSVFDSNEEFRLKTTSCVCQYMMEEEYKALIVITNMKIYILHINTDDISVEPKDALTCAEIQPLAELKQVEVGLGRQTVRLEFKTDCSSYTLIMRNEEKMDAFLERLSDHLKTYAMETDVPMTTVFSEDVDQQTVDNLAADVLKQGGEAGSLRLYVLGYIVRGHNLQYPVAFVVSTAEVCLVRTNHQWPSPRLQAPVTVETVGRQFVVLERQKINNIATVVRHATNDHLMQISFFNETSGEETKWLITMDLEKNILAMINAIKHPWEEAFGVEMDIEMEDFELCF